MGEVVVGDVVGVGVAGVAGVAGAGGAVGPVGAVGATGAAGVASDGCATTLHFDSSTIT